MPLSRTKESQARMSSQEALKLLKDGNQRFASGKMLNRDFTSQVKITAKDQYPFAVVLSCIDSRVAPELIFDQGIGDIFDIRIGGNVVNNDVLGGLEFACKVSGAKLIVVIGHTNCGAVIGAIDDVHLGNLTQMLEKIKPAIEAIKFEGEKTSTNFDYVDLVSKENVLRTIEEIKLQSELLKKMLKNDEIGIVGAMYNLETGLVEFY